MVFMEVLQAVYTLNPGIIIGLVMNNLFWFFPFLAAGHIFTDGKAALRNGIIYSLLVTTSIDLFKLTGFSIYTAFGLGLLYMLRVPLLLYLEKTGNLSRFTPMAWTLSFFFVIA